MGPRNQSQGKKIKSKKIRLKNAAQAAAIFLKRDHSEILVEEIIQITMN